jgi:hypothetical protein
MTGGKLVSFTETYATTCIIIAFYQCLTAQKNKHYFISGLLAGLACCFRVSAVFGLLAVFITIIRRGFAASCVFMAGVLSGGLLLVALCWFTGIELAAFVHYAVTGNFGQGSTTDHSLHWKTESFTTNFFYSELVLFYPLVAGYFMLYKKIDAPATWLICTFIGINVLGIYADPHFKELLPAFAIMSALTLTQLTETYQVPYKGLLVIVWLCFFPKVLEPFWGVKKLLSRSTINPNSFCHEPVVAANDEAEKQLGLWIKDATKVTDLVYVAGYGARVQAYSERLSPTIYFNITQTAIAKEQLFKDLARNKPALVAVPVFTNYASFVDKDLREYVSDLVAKEYVFQQCLYGYNVYVAKSRD